MFRLCIALLGLATAAAEATEPPEAELQFVDECVAALQKEGRPREAAGAACDCIAKRTTERPELRDEFLTQIVAPRPSMSKSSPALRQVRAACVPMPILIQGDAS